MSKTLLSFHLWNWRILARSEYDVNKNYSKILTRSAEQRIHVALLYLVRCERKIEIAKKNEQILEKTLLSSHPCGIYIRALPQSCCICALLRPVFPLICNSSRICAASISIIEKTNAFNSSLISALFVGSFVKHRDKKSWNWADHLSRSWSWGGGPLGIMKSTLIGCRSELGGTVSAISINVIPEGISINTRTTKKNYKQNTNLNSKYLPYNRVCPGSLLQEPSNKEFQLQYFCEKMYYEDEYWVQNPLNKG